MRMTHLIYFSPTRTTRTISTQIAQNLGSDEIVTYDLTLPGPAVEIELTEGVAVIGIPVYAGRVPETCLERLKGITAAGIPVVLVALYGNREFEDALVELRDLTTAQGFKPIAAGAFIGEHSYSTSNQPIAAGRPNADDLACAAEFGQQVAAKLAQKDDSLPSIAGDVPYRERVQFGGVAPETDPEKCTLCGKCEQVCPTGVIKVTDTVTTDAENCIMCCACIKVCEYDARFFDHPHIQERRGMLVANCTEPKEPVIFL